MFREIKLVVRGQLKNWPLYVLLLVVSIAYINSLRVPFHFDDGIAFAQVIPSEKLSPKEQLSALFNYPARILPMLSFFAQFHIAGENLLFLHLVNVGIHVLNVLLIYWLTKQLLHFLAPKSLESKHFVIISFFSALLFAVHPVNTQAVTYLVQRMAAMVTLFYFLSIDLLLLSFWFKEKSRNYPSLVAVAGMMLAATAAFYSKENSYTLPIVLLMTLLIVGRRKLTTKSFGMYIIGITIVFAISLTLFAMRPNPTSQVLLARPAPNGFYYTPLSYGLTQLSLYPRYIGMLVIPVNQSIDHMPTPFTSLQTPVLLGVLLIVGLIVVSSYFFRKHPIVSYGILWYMITMLVESSVIAINDAFVEHRLYLPMIGLLIAGVYLSYLYAIRKNKRTSFLAFLTAFAILLSIATIRRNVTWRSEESLWKDAAKVSSQNPRAQYNYAVSAIIANHPQDALQPLTEAIALRPDYHRAHNNLGVLLFAIKDYAGSRYHFLEAVRYDMKNEVYISNLSKSIRAVDTDEPPTETPAFIKEMFN